MSTITRRSFTTGAAAAAALVAASSGVALADDASSQAADAQGKEAGAQDILPVTQRLIDRGVIGANLPEAAPIAPAPEPDSWDDEADVVVVGLGGGGLVACGHLAQNGLKVIGLEKDGVVGGASRHACDLAVLTGGTKAQDEAGFPGFFNGDIDAAVRYSEQLTGFTSNEGLIRTLASEGPAAFDWINEQDGVDLVCLGLGFHDRAVVEGRQNHVLGLTNLIDALEADAKAYGADLRTLTQVEQLVTDEDGNVVGVVADDPDSNTVYIHATKAVVLTAGGFGMNEDLIKAYLPSAVEGAVQGGPMPTHTGEVFRMGLGVGADFDGYDSWSCWEAGIDERTAGGDGKFFHYFWNGARQLFHNPWLLIDKKGNRLPYYSMVQPTFADAAPGGNMGDLPTVNSWIAGLGHKAISVCDSKFPDEVFKKNTTDTSQPFVDVSRIPITADQTIAPGAEGLVSTDWVGEVNDAVERGAVKKADTLEELAEQLDMDPQVLTDAVNHYNELCDKGVDDELAFPYDASWLSRIDTPPYYAAIIGGQIGKTNCGLRVNKDLQVTDENGDPIGGLWAGYSTLGGSNGNGNNGSYWNGGAFFGGVGSSLATGYIIAEHLLAQ